MRTKQTSSNVCLAGGQTHIKEEPYMRIEMETMNPIELIRRTAEETQYLMDVRRESKKTRRLA